MKLSNFGMEEAKGSISLLQQLDFAAMTAEAFSHATACITDVIAKCDEFATTPTPMEKLSQGIASGLYSDKQIHYLTIATEQEDHDWQTAHDKDVQERISEVTPLVSASEVLVLDKRIGGKVTYKLNFIAIDYFNTLKTFNFKSLNAEQFVAAIDLIAEYKITADAFHGKTIGVAAFVKVSEEMLANFTAQLGLAKAA